MAVKTAFYQQNKALIKLLEAASRHKIIHAIGVYPILKAENKRNDIFPFPFAAQTPPRLLPIGKPFF